MPGKYEIGRMLDLADDALCELGSRGHTFAWLALSLDEEPVPVDGYWPDAGLIAEVTLGAPDDACYRRAALAALYGLRYVVLNAGALRLSLDAHQLAVVRTMLKRPVVEELVVDTVSGPRMLTAVGFVPTEDLSDYEAAADQRPCDWQRRPRFDPGWRGRGIGLAALGAHVLARRTLEPWAAGTGMSEPECRLLAALVLAGSATSETELVELLAASPGDITQAAEALVARGLVTDGRGVEFAEDLVERVTNEGIAEVHEWLARIAPQFTGWPPDSAVDDVV